MARVSLTAAQIQEGLGAELFSLCQGITADGKLTKAEVITLGLWLRSNKDAPMPGIAMLSETLNRIIADGRVTREEEKELLEAIEKVLPVSYRKEARAARMAVRSERLAKEKVAKSEIKERSRPVEWFDFMVAGVGFDGRDQLVTRNLQAGSRVRVSPEPDNAYDRHAVLVTLTDGRAIGYVPKAEAEAVSNCTRTCGYYYATVKKIIPGRSFPIPVIILRFYLAHQLDALSDRSPDPCLRAPVRAARPMPAIVTTERFEEPRKPWWKVW